MSTGNGVWLLASRALGRPVPVDEHPDPHVCGVEVGTDNLGQPVRLTAAQCAACATRGRRTSRPARY